MTSRRVGIDIGGTFTDFVLEESDGSLRTLKVRSTPDDPARAVLEGLDRLRESGTIATAGVSGGSEAAAGVELDVVHGSTVATNAVLERKGARTALVTTSGFRDVLAIARQARPELYDLFADRPEPPVPSGRCFELTERIDPRGEVLRPLAEGELTRLLDALRESAAESVAVCFLFSFARPDHERRVGRALRRAGFPVSLSSEVLPEFREYERASTTVLNAYVSPILDRYLGRLERELPEGTFRILQSNGGSVTARTARQQGVRSLLSGPAGGVVGAVRVAEAAGFERILTLDMGGTSTDVSLAESGPRVTTEATIGGMPVGVPVIDLHTVGSGGGSIARVDAGGALRVGPESAGAEPGPVCYDRGGRRPTVTDANLVLGRIPRAGLLGGELELDVEAAERALAELAREAGLDRRDDGGAERTSSAGRVRAARTAALGVVRIANAHMERALRVISVERGHDPADFALVAFGGAGGLHACALARALGIGRVLFPPAASTLSALGMLAADVVKDYSRTVMLPGTASADEVSRRLAPLAERGRRELREERVPEDEIAIERSLDVRYRGQSYELTVPFGENFEERFHEAHRRVYGHAEPGAPVELVNVRVRAVGGVRPPALPKARARDPDPAAALLDRRATVVGSTGASGSRRGIETADIPFYRGERLRPGQRPATPAVVVRADTTVFLPAGVRARVDRRFNLVAESDG